MQSPVVSVSAVRRAAACLCAAAALLLYPASSLDAQRHTGGGQVVQERLDPHVGTAVTVCVEAAPGVTGHKRAVVVHGGVRVSVATDDAEGASCASFQAEDGAVTVRLEYMRLGLVRSRLTVRTYRAAELRGRLLVFRWVRG
jgi:hypothetical protein